MDFLLFKAVKKKQYLFSAAIIISVAGVCFGFSEFIGYRVVALILLLTVSLLAITIDILPVLISSALSALIWNFFFIPPRFTIHVDSTEDNILFIMYFVIAMISGVLSYKIRKVEKKLQLKAERANSVKLYNTILNSLSHELRTPISAIIGATDNLLTNKNLTKDDKDLLIIEISKASLRLNQQVENLLNISRIESGHIKPKNDWCDVVELIYEVVKRVEENNLNRIISININQYLPLCYIDLGMMEQVIYNLLNNAAIHTSPECEISIDAACHSDLLTINIEDSGKGFNNIDAKEIFHKFSREKKTSSPGSGLGLSIVKGFTEALGGIVELQYQKSGGTKFTLSFPVKISHLNMNDEQSGNINY